MQNPCPSCGAAPCKCVFPCIGGRASLAKVDVAYHLFGSIAVFVGETLTYVPPTKLIYLSRDRCRFRCGVVRIAIAGPEIQRCGTDARPLPTTIFGNPLLGFPGTASVLPPGASFSPRSQFKVFIGFDDDTPCPRKVCFDIGQTIEIIADCCTSIGLVVPENVEIVGGNGSPTASGLVVDAFIKAGIWEVESPTGIIGGHCTDVVVVPGGAQVCVPVPDGAQEVQIFQTSAGAAGQWTMFYGDASILTTCAFPHGVITPETSVNGLGAPVLGRQTPIKRVGNTTHICSDVDQGADRTFTFVWRIEP